ncbi:GGDEF domain-containing protein [Photobacterium atrarenae]|uniref:diguanylate cyclase n=1 Tax=Photobacterium atrarenae TaxID=865757 RepID=A0ABY5GQ13_9GAMM|nr:GGDEF domain-containing protein [Photobacterium atrarenae]UTV30836.1 GGDEF domain-containing protein [Photobacterium atrarenae]
MDHKKGIILRLLTFFSPVKGELVATLLILLFILLVTTPKNFINNYKLRAQAEDLELVELVYLQRIQNIEAALMLVRQQATTTYEANAVVKALPKSLSNHISQIDVLDQTHYRNFNADLKLNIGALDHYASEAPFNIALADNGNSYFILTATDRQIPLHYVATVNSAQLWAVPNNNVMVLNTDSQGNVLFSHSENKGKIDKLLLHTLKTSPTSEGYYLYRSENISYRIMNSGGQTLYMLFIDRFRLVDRIYFLMTAIGFVAIVLLLSVYQVNRKRKQAHYQSSIDELSQLFNRKHLHRNKRKIEAQPDQFVALLDIDHFKSVNDTFGHITGDKVIKQISQLLKDNARKKDIVFRYGGEEFLMILNADSQAEAEKIFNRIRQRIESAPLDPKITVSIGIAKLEGSIDRALAEADKYLYVAKASGRNQVCSALE